MSAYYNEHDPFAAAWLREIIADGLIAPGDVDERSIEDVTVSDLAGYKQCHFFAGIGVWSLALRRAGWPDDRPIWTGSCPCQPFSEAGKGAGFADERHLWPAFQHLIRIGKPNAVLGEQVADFRGLAWLDLVQADMEAEGYAFGALDTCAAGFGAPHRRQRLYWVALANEGQRGRLTNGEERQRDRPARGWLESDGQPQSCGDVLCVDDTASTRCDGPLADTESQTRHEARLRLLSAGCGQDRHGEPGPANGLWRDADWLYGRDGKWRAAEAGTFPLANARSVINRLGKLRGSGNALNVAQAQGFVEAVMLAHNPPQASAPKEADES